MNHSASRYSLCFRQKTIKASRPNVFNFGRFLGIFAEFYQFFAFAVIAHASRDSVVRKTGLTV
jgi:hypothetical protein